MLHTFESAKMRKSQMEMSEQRHQAFQKQKEIIEDLQKRAAEMQNCVGKYLNSQIAQIRCRKEVDDAQVVLKAIQEQYSIMQDLLDHNEWEAISRILLKITRRNSEILKSMNDQNTNLRLQLRQPQQDSLKAEQYKRPAFEVGKGKRVA